MYKGRGQPRKRTPLSDLLCHAIGPTIQAAADKMELHPISVHRWLRLNRIPPLQAARIVDLSNGRVTLADFYPFIFLTDEEQRDWFE